MAASGDSGVEDMILFSTLSILQLIKDAQQQHGLRHGDFQRYRAYCARKIRRIRRSLHFTNAHKSVPKHPAKFQAKKVNAPENITEIRYLLIPIFDAERCWAHAMQLKQEMEDGSTRKKFHMISKLHKAVKHALNLEQLVRSLPRVDPPTQLEVQAYSSWIQGCLFFEQQNWIKAKESFTASKTIYEKLSDVVSNERIVDLYKGRCQEAVPQLRYCAYNIGEETANIQELMQMKLQIGGQTGADEVMGQDLDRLIQQTREKQQTAQKAEVKWGGTVVSLERPAKVQTFYNSLQQFDSALTNAESMEDKMSLYEKLLIDCRDAIQLLRDETKNETLKGRADPISTAQAQALHSYLSYVRLSKTVERYLLLIDNDRNGKEGRKGKAQDFVRLYDTVLQSLQETEGLVESDKKLSREIGIKTAYYKTFRCYYVAEAYGAMKKWPEALVLYDRTLDHIRSAVEVLKQAGKAGNIDGLSVVSLEELVDTVNGAKYAAQAKSLFSTLDQENETVAADTLEKPLLEDLEVYHRLNPSEIAAGKVPSLVSLPPEFQPMPCKPLFFDLALNHVQFPALEDKIEVPSPQKQEKGQKGTEEGPGLTGMMKGWFWGGGKK